MKRISTFLALPENRYQELFSTIDQKRMDEYCRFIGGSPAGFTGWQPDPYLWADTEILVTGWGTPVVPMEIIEQMPMLKLVAHAGATPRLFPDPLQNNPGVRIALATEALGRSVAEFAFSLLVLGTKRAFWMERRVREGGWRDSSRFFGGCFELYEARIGLIGGGAVARHLMKLLQPLKCDISVYDPYIDPLLITSMGGRIVDSLHQLCRESQVVSVHLPHNNETHEMLRAEHFRLLNDGTLFVNTARGPVLHEEEFITELKKERFVACLDVANQEPPPASHPFRHLPNVILTPHVAGAIAENRFRLGKAVVDEIERFATHRPLRDEITRVQKFSVC